MLINAETIVKDTSGLIRKRSEDVPLPLSDEDKHLMLDMLRYVDESTIPEIAERKKLKPAVGISAIQIGTPKKMAAIVLKDTEGNKTVEYALVNPKIIANSLEKSYLVTGEACLSVDADHQGYVYRSARVKVKAYDLLQEKEIIIKADGYLSIVLQHEIDHHKGILFYDRIDKSRPFYKDPDALPVSLTINK